MMEIHSALKALLAELPDEVNAPDFTLYQEAYLRFRGLVADAAKQNEVYHQWAQQYLPDVSNETGEVVKLHESIAELRADIAVFIRLMERTD